MKQQTKKYTLEQALKAVDDIFNNIEGYKVVGSMGNSTNESDYRYQVVIATNERAKLFGKF